ncbi:MAG: hypothetical protein AAGU27_08220 [Dehalobacterium sp.]
MKNKTIKNDLEQKGVIFLCLKGTAQRKGNGGQQDGILGTKIEKQRRTAE